MESNLEQQTPKLNVTNISSAVFGKDGPALGEESKIGKLSRILRTTRLKVNNLEKVIVNQEKLINLTEEKTNDNTKKNTINAEKITRLKNILQNQKSDVGEKLLDSTAEKEKAKLNTTLEETNRILVEIQKQLAYDFAMRVVEEKKEAEDEKEATSKRRFKREETALEKSAKSVVNTVKSATKKIVSPLGNIFQKLLAFLGILGKGIGVNAVFEFFKDEENRKQITKFFNVLKENWQTLALIAGVLAGGILVAKIIGFTLALKGLSAFLLNPITLSAIGLLAATVFAMTAKTTSENLASIVGDDDNKRREMIKGFEQMREMDDEKLKQVSGQEPRGFREELNKQIYFLKTGRPLLYDRSQKGLFPPSYREMADSATFREGLAFSKFEDKGARLQGIFEGPSFVQPIEQRAMGGPVIAGNTYLVGEKGPELVKFSENGQVINNMQTEKIYKMITSGKKGRTRIVELPPQTIEGPKPEIKLPQGPATKAPKISSSNSLDGYRSVTSEIYGIMV